MRGLPVRFVTTLLSATLPLAARAAAQDGLVPDGAIRIRILDPGGAPVQHATVTLLRVVADPQRGLLRFDVVPDCLQQERLVPAHFADGYAVRDGLPDGTFVLRVSAPPFAPTLSPPFRLPGEPAPEVVVRLCRGGSLLGRVLDEGGRPIADADVATGTAHDLVVWFALRYLPARTDLITRTSTRTDAAGRFRLSGLAHADYRLQVTHPDFCGACLEASVLADDPLELDDVRLQAGAVVAGRASLAGRPLAGALVAVPGAGPGGATLRAITDAEGRYRLPRVPRGRWTLRVVECLDPMLDAGDDGQRPRRRAAEASLEFVVEARTVGLTLDPALRYR